MKIPQKIIDSHIHLDNWFDPAGKDYIRCLDEVQENTGIERLCIAALGHKQIGGPDINLMAAIYKLHNPTAYAYGALVHPEYPAKREFPEGMDPLSQYEQLMAMGFDGIKFLYGPDEVKELELSIDDPVYEPLFARMEKDGTQILWHVADPEADWHGSDLRPHRYDESHPSFEDLFRQVFRVVARHPNLHITFAHFAFLEEYPEILEGLFTKYPNISVDLTPGTMFWEFDKHRAYFKDFLEKHAHRLIYGSDSFVPGNPDSENLIVDVYRWIATKERACVWGYEMEGLALSEEACEKILYQNFLVRNPQPQKADKEAMKRYWDMYGHLIVRQTNKTQLAAFLEK